MSDGVDPFGFGKFIPGFDFLQSLAQGAKADAQATADAPQPPQWLAFTTDVQEIDKRIQELRAVQFWLEQNSRALTATIQALEVQKMTLSALKSMPAGLGQWAAAADSAPKQEAKPGQAAPGAQAATDPLQLWGALTEQFQQIASQALQEPAAQQAMQAGAQMAENFARSAMQAGADLGAEAKPEAKPAAKKTAKKSARKTSPAASKPAASAAAKKPVAAAKTGKNAVKKPAA